MIIYNYINIIIIHNGNKIGTGAKYCQDWCLCDPRWCKNQGLNQNEHQDLATADECRNLNYR